MGRYTLSIDDMKQNSELLRSMFFLPLHPSAGNRRSRLPEQELFLGRVIDEVSLIPISSIYSFTIFVFVSSVSFSLSSGRKLKAIWPTGFEILGFICLWNSKLSMMSCVVVSNTPSEARILASFCLPFCSLTSISRSPSWRT